MTQHPTHEQFTDTHSVDDLAHPKERRDGWSPDRQVVFLEAVARTGCGEKGGVNGVNFERMGHHSKCSGRCSALDAEHGTDGRDSHPGLRIQCGARGPKSQGKAPCDLCELWKDVAPPPFRSS